MVDTDLAGANLTKTNFTGANIQDVILTHAHRCGTIRSDGSIDDASCPERSTTTTTPGTTTTTRAGGATTTTRPGGATTTTRSGAATTTTRAGGTTPS